jgi:antitoxin HicB
MSDWAYAVAIRQEEDGRHHVYARDLPEVVSSGADEADALAMAADAIEVAVAGRMEDGIDLPAPSPAERGEVMVALPAWLAAKASIYSAWKASGLTKVALAQLMGRNETEVRRILEPRYGTKLAQLEEAARALGGRLAVGFVREEEAA